MVVLSSENTFHKGENVSDLSLQLGGITYTIREGSAAVELQIAQVHSPLNPFGMSFSEQQEVILETLMAFQERTDH